MSGWYPFDTTPGSGDARSFCPHDDEHEIPEDCPASPYYVKPSMDTWPAFALALAASLVYSMVAVYLHWYFLNGTGALVGLAIFLRLTGWRVKVVRVHHPRHRREP